MRASASWAGWAAVVATCAACAASPIVPAEDGGCTGNADCPGGVCIDGTCRYADGDGEVPDAPEADADVPDLDTVENGEEDEGAGPDADAPDDGPTEWTPGTERCGDALDNDGDTLVDEGCTCVPDTSQDCYVGPEPAAGIGICARGRQDCHPLGEFGEWGECTGSVPPGTEVCDDTLDNDCDGSADEGCVCTASDRRACYTGPAGSEGVGFCRGGSQYCLDVDDGGTAWGECGGQVLPTPDVCDGEDNDCDGVADDLCSCPAGTPRACYEGPLETRRRGICSDGAQDCLSDPGGVITSWGLCLGWSGPATETCGNGADDDCDGMTDEGCGCLLGGTRSCYVGPAGTEGVGLCASGRETCVAAGGGTGWGPCVGSILPATDVCDAEDNDCNGTTDDDCACPPLATGSCYPGPAGTLGVGTCLAGMHECLWDTGSTTSTWSACLGWQGPRTETCDAADNDCDGTVDEGCTCTGGSSRSCYSGLPTTAGVGLCHTGSQTCIDLGGGAFGWGSCVGEVTPVSEICGNGLDDDCDAWRDEGCVCTPGASRSCYTGPPGTAGTGSCRAGTQSCNPLPEGGSDWATCLGQILPVVETCADGIDNDCDGVGDEGCSCTPGNVQPCYDGPPATRGRGECRDGSRVCVETPGSGSSWGACTGQRLPAAEVCGNGLDEDCNGVADNGCASPPWVTCPASPLSVIARATNVLSATDGDPDGDIVSRRWEVLTGPPGMLSTFGCPTCASTSFRADIAGVYTLRYTATDGGGRSASCSVTINVTGLGLRIEVTWASATADIDLHLLDGDGGWWSTYAEDDGDCHWRNCRPSLAWPPTGTNGDARLDIDDMGGYGPENINVDVVNLGETYRVGVHWWLGHGDTSSEVSLRIFCGNISAVPARVFTRTLHGESAVRYGPSSLNDFWKVADVVFIDTDRCDVTAIDTIVPAGTSVDPLLSTNIPR